MSGVLENRTRGTRSESRRNHDSPTYEVDSRANLGTIAPSQTGRNIAGWADSPEKIVFSWVVGGPILIGLLALIVTMKMDKD